MSDNYNNNDVEKLIFRDGLASAAIEPSEKFWNKAYEDIIQRDNRANANRVSRWRTGFIIMGTAAFIFGGYIFYMQNEVNEIKQQLTTIESARNTIHQNESQGVVASTTEKMPAITKVKSTNRQGNIQHTNEVTAINAVPIKSNNAFSNKQSGKTSNGHNASYTNALKTAPRVGNINSSANDIPSVITNPIPIVNKVSTDKPVSEANTPSVAGKNSPQPPGNNLPAVVIPAQVPSIQTAKTALVNPKEMHSAKKTDSIAVPSSLDSANLAYIPKRPITLAGILSKTSLSAFYAPGITDDFLNDKNNDPTNTITAHELKTQQDGDGTFAVGFRLAYDISGKWTIQTGAYYSQYTYNINPTVIYAQQQENGQVGYSITTSSGTVFLPNSAVPAHLGDSIRVKGSSSRGYISIPLQVKYKLAAGAKLSLYIDGGFSVNIANYKETQIHWDNTLLQEGDVSVQSIYGLNSVQYSYNFGFGAAYLLGKGLSIYTEPFVDGSFTSINKNTPVITYPYFFGLAVGITYHF